jgi:hypothetical protein
MALRCIQVLVLFLIVVLVDLQTCGMQSVTADENAALIMYPSGTAVSTHTLGGTKELTYDVVAKYQLLALSPGYRRSYKRTGGSLSHTTP